MVKKDIKGSLAGNTSTIFSTTFNEKSGALKSKRNALRVAHGRK
jgi:hypothetical protein